MEYLPISNSAWLTYKEFVIPEITTPENYRWMKKRGNLRASCTGGNGRTIYVEFDSLPAKYQKLVEEKYGDPKQYIAIQPMKELLRTDDVARKWYADYEIPNAKGKKIQRFLPLDEQLKYGRSCDWLNLIGLCLKDKKYLKERLKISVIQFWENIASLIRGDETPHNLPGSVDRLRRIFNRYEDEGYVCLVNPHYGNSRARKVTDKIEGLILSLYCQPHKPYMAHVCSDFHKFMKGEKQVVDMVTGEVYDPVDFYVKGKPYLLGESTVDYYVKKPVNQALVNKGRMKGLDYNTQFRPSVKRKAPFYAFSKVTMDDIDIPFLGPDGDRPVKTYQVFDVASQAVIGVAFARDKTTDLVREAIRDMFRLIIRKGWGIPFEIEMEKHLTSAMSDNDVFTPGAVFPATRVCLGGNAKEKRAEHIIKVKKYGQQKKREGFMYRHYAKLLTNRLNTDAKQLRREYEEIVENELADIAAHNNELHPKQDLYPGMTRWQVLEENQNPNLPKFQLQTVIQFIGFSAATSIRAGKAQVQYASYQLPDINLIDAQHYNGEITAYYLPDEDGNVSSVFLFENGEFICEAKKVMGFQEAIIEQTAADLEIADQQWGQQSAYDKMVRDGKQRKIAKVGTVMFDGFAEPKDVKVVRETGSMPPLQNDSMSAKERALNDV